jgi:hypothetical protein
MKSFWKSEATGCTELVSGLLPEKRKPQYENITHKYG